LKLTLSKLKLEKFWKKSFADFKKEEKKNRLSMAPGSEPITRSAYPSQSSIEPKVETPYHQLDVPSGQPIKYDSFNTERVEDPIRTTRDRPAPPPPKKFQGIEFNNEMLTISVPPPPPPKATGENILFQNSDK
jgi:hypothetical protein